jgi:hypothetical protein
MREEAKSRAKKRLKDRLSDPKQEKLISVSSSDWGKSGDNGKKERRTETRDER